jgi:hypothetical protein
VVKDKLVLGDYGMGRWKIREIEKKARGRQESGRSKGLCPDPLVRYICRANRSWKHPQYDRIMTINKSSPNPGEFTRKGKK